MPALFYFNIIKAIIVVFTGLILFKYAFFVILAPLYTIFEAARIRKVKQLIKKGILDPNYQPLISVVVPAWNEEVGILKTIKSILNSDYQNLELVVINDGSTDDSDKIVRNYIAMEKIRGNQRVDCLKYFFQSNGGKGKALNFAIEQTSGEIILTVDGDSAIAANSVTNLVKYFQDPAISAVVGNVKVTNTQTLVGLIQELEYSFGFYFKRAHAVMGAEYIFGGACAAFRKSVLEKYGLFDTANKTEDIEMSLRLKFNGQHCTYAEDVICYTEGADTIHGLINQRLRWKKGRMDTFIRYRKLFFSSHNDHNVFLAFFVLPLSIISELQLFLEPISLAFLIGYSVVSGDYLSLGLAALFTFAVYMVKAFFSHDGFSPRYLVLFIFTWPLFYFLVWIEFLALCKTISMYINKKDIQWQSWQRTGLKPNN